MEFQDKSLRCVDCGSEFIWTAGEQLFFADKQFKNEPKRCKTCKAKRANRVSAGPAPARDRVETTTQCSACGKETTVPFRPTQGVDHVSRVEIHPTRLEFQAVVVRNRKGQTRGSTPSPRCGGHPVWPCLSVLESVLSTGSTFEELCRSRNDPPVM